MGKRHARSPAGRSRLRRLGLVLLGRVGALLLAGAALLTVGVGIGVLIARQRPEALRAFRWEIAEPLIYLALLVLMLRGSRYLRWLVGAFCASAALMAALALLQVAALHVTFSPLATAISSSPMPHHAPPASTTAAATALGALLERALPILLALLIVPHAANRADPPPRPRSASRLIAAGLWVSASRGAALGAAAGCLLVLLVAVGRRWFSFALLAALALAALWQRDRLAQEFLAGHGGSGEVRTLVWRAAWSMIRDHPILGIGPDQFLYYYSSRYTNHPYWIPFENGHPTPAIYEPNLSHPHNLPLELWLSGGLLALGGFALILWDLARRFLRLSASRHAGLACRLRPRRRRLHPRRPRPRPRRQRLLRPRPRPRLLVGRRPRSSSSANATHARLVTPPPSTFWFSLASRRITLG